MITFRIATEKDILGIVDLFSQEGNAYNWSEERYKHFYQDYPLEGVVSFVAEFKDIIIGHYGILPVVIGNYNALFGVHAFINQKYRNLKVIRGLFQSLDNWCKDHQIDFICAVPNPDFSLVKSKFFGWKEIFNLGFMTKECFSFSEYHNRELFINYSEDMLLWRFGKVQDVYISKYFREGSWSYQVLYANDDVGLTYANSFGVADFQYWHPDAYFLERKKEFTQPFSIKIFNLEHEEFLTNPNNWFIQMGDSDAFVYTPLD